MRFRTMTLGCRVNQYETEFVRTALLASGWTEAERDDPASADLVIVNSCSVTAESDAKSRKMISGAASESPNAEIIVMGCFASSNPQKAASYPHVSEVLTDKRLLADFLRRRGWTVPTGIDSFGQRHRAYVKIQDGCRVGCSYCIIPKVRPYLSSRTEGDILREVSHLAEKGFREILLTGIHLGHYGLDLIAADRNGHPETLTEFLEEREKGDGERRHSLARLLRRLVDLKAGVRFRLGSLEAVEVTDELAETVAENPSSVCPHFHLSMQSGDDAVLARMKRRWPSGPFIDRSLSLRERIPNVALTTDVIVGFPGETEEEFARTCDVVRQIGFAKIHIFRYSRRPGTAAADLPNQIPERVKKGRAAHLSEIADSLRADYARSLVGEEGTVLVENRRVSPDGSTVILSGTNEFYLPTEFSRPAEFSRSIEFSRPTEFSEPIKKGTFLPRDFDPSSCEMGEMIRLKFTDACGELLRGERQDV